MDSLEAAAQKAGRLPLGAPGAEKPCPLLPGAFPLQYPLHEPKSSFHQPVQPFIPIFGGLHHALMHLGSSCRPSAERLPVEEREAPNPLRLGEKHREIQIRPCYSPRTLKALGGSLTLAILPGRLKDAVIMVGVATRLCQTRRGVRCGCRAGPLRVPLLPVTGAEGFPKEQHRPLPSLPTVLSTTRKQTWQEGCQMGARWNRLLGFNREREAGIVVNCGGGTGWGTTRPWEATTTEDPETRTP